MGEGNDEAVLATFWRLADEREGPCDRFGTRRGAPGSGEEAGGLRRTGRVRVVRGAGRGIGDRQPGALKTQSCGVVDSR